MLISTYKYIIFNTVLHRFPDNLLGLKIRNQKFVITVYNVM